MSGDETETRLQFNSILNSIVLFQRRFLDPDGSTNGHTHVRVKRGFFGKKGFLRTLFSTAYEVLFSQCKIFK